MRLGGKKMNGKTIVAILPLAFCAVAQADVSAALDGGWRVSVGPVYDPGVNADLHFTPKATYAAPFTRGPSKASAWKKASGTKTTDTRTDFDNGSWIDTDDPVYSSGDDVGRTRYYRLNGSPEDGGHFSLGEASYSEVTETSQGGSPSAWAEDESGMLGVSLELSRNLYHDADIGWGLDAAFDVHYFKHNGIFSARTSWLNGSSTLRSGRYSSSIDLSGGDYDEWNWHSDAGGSFYGSGNYSGNAGPIDGTSVNVANTESLRSHSSYGGLEAEGDYENLEMILMARPYYDVFDWLRVNAMLGLVVSRQDLDFSMTILRDGAVDYRSNRDFSQWDVYGVAGAGLMAYYRDFTLGVDVLARFLDRDLDVKDDYVNGSVERGSWMFRITLGYEF